MLQIQFYWRLIFAVLAMIAAISPWSAWVPLSVLWQKILLSIVLQAVAVFSIVGAAQIARRKHSGRIISLTLDYLGFVFCFIITLNTGKVFTGIDALGETFGQGVPYLGIVLLGYLLGTLDDRFPQKNKSSTTSLKAVSRWVMIAGFILFLWQVEAVNCLLYFLEKLAQPVGIVAVTGMLVFGLSLWSLARYEAAVEQARKQAEELRKGTLETARIDQVRILAEARSTAEHEVTQARSGVAAALAGARGALRGETEVLAREVASRVLGRALS